MATPSSYYMTVSSGVNVGEFRAYVQLYDEDNQPVGPCKTLEGTTFCWTWKDLVLWLEGHFTENGGVLNNAIHRPSPFVDLT